MNAIGAYLLSVALLDVDQGGLGEDSRGHVAILAVVVVLQGAVLAWLVCWLLWSFVGP